MFRRYGFAICTALFALTLLLQACSDAPAPDKPLDIAPPAPSAAASTIPSPTAALTAAPTRSPAATPKATKSPAAEKTPKPSLTPTPDVGRVTLADGFYYQKLDSALKKRITGISYPSDDKNSGISYDDLRYIGLKYYDFDGEVHKGELIVNKKLAQEVMEIFYALYEAEYPFTSIRLVDDFKEPGDDAKSMAANNTSAFNYRHVYASKTLSRHSYGAAIDINPKLNPYIVGKRVAPKNGAKYADRSLDFPGKIDHDDLCYKLFIKKGWTWGGDWTGDKDYQHFSKDIGR